MSAATAKSLIDPTTAQIVQLMAAAVTNLDTNRATWHEILDTAKLDLETVTREAVLSNDHQYSMASPHWQQKVQVMLLRVELLEQLCSLLPLRDEDQTSYD